MFKKNSGGVGVVSKLLLAAIFTGTVVTTAVQTNRDDFDLYISSETYRVSHGDTMIVGDISQIEDLDADEIPVESDSSQASKTETLAVNVVPLETVSETSPVEDASANVVETEALIETAETVITETNMEPNPTDENVNAVAEPTEKTVYWVKSGEVWHLSDKCSSLSRSKNILSGTVEAAIENGKMRVCKRCGN